MRLTPKRFTFGCILALFLYLSLYTWNQRTGYLDSLAANTGLEFVGLTLVPGKWVADQVTGFWNKYVYLVGVREENAALKARVEALSMTAERLREEAAQARRLRELVAVSFPEPWRPVGGRVIAHRLGPQAALETLMLDKGFTAGVEVSTPVATHEGLVGRVLRRSPHVSNALLVTDPNSRVAVRGQDSRTSGILVGMGAGVEPQLLYVPLNAALEVGEVLITSGLASIYPAGLPVAEVVAIERSEISLFQTVTTRPMADISSLEEVLLLLRPVNEEHLVDEAALVADPAP